MLSKHSKNYTIIRLFPKFLGFFKNRPVYVYMHIWCYFFCILYVVNKHYYSYYTFLESFYLSSLCTYNFSIWIFAFFLFYQDGAQKFAYHSIHVIELNITRPPHHLPSVGSYYKKFKKSLRRITLFSRFSISPPVIHLPSPKRTYYFHEI